MSILLFHVLNWWTGYAFIHLVGPASVAQLDAPSDWRQEVAGSTPAEVGNILSWIDHEIFYILSLLQIQEGQLAVSGGRTCTILVNCLED